LWGTVSRKLLDFYFVFAYYFKRVNSKAFSSIGTRPPPSSWEKWNLKLLEPSNIRELQDDRTQNLKANMSFDLDTCLEDNYAPTGKLEKAATQTGQGSPSRMGMAVIPTFDSTEVL